MFKKFVNILWTYSLQDYWRALWSRTSLDEKAIARLKEIKKRYKLTAQELQDVAKAIKEVGNQLEDIDDAVKGKPRKGRKKMEMK
jgi:chromosome segregation ATPase